MKSPASFRRLLLVCVMLASAGFFSQTLAQNGGEEMIARSALQLTAGEVLEIMGVHADGNAQYDWILTQKGTFMEAGRESIFRTRFTQAGTYMLEGQRTDATGIRRLHIDVDVLPRTESGPEPRGIGLNIVTTNPPGGKSGVQISHERPLLALIPSPALLGPISLDLDVRVDANGDGDPGNDNDGGDTLFTTEHNTLYLWYSDQESAGRMHLTTIAEDGTPVEQEIAVILGAAPVPAGDIIAGPEQNGTLNFHFDLDSSIEPSTVVYQWDFGDGRGSQIDEPSHTYGVNGQYVVRVNVRELATGRIVAQGETGFSVNNILEITAAASSVSSASGSAQGGQDAGSLSGTLVKILLALLVAIVLGALGVWAAMKFLHREGKLQKALEQVEGKLTKKDTATPAAGDIAPATMKLKRPDTPQEELAGKVSVVETVPEKGPMKRPPAPPIAVEAAAPSWLQKGLESTKEGSTPDAGTPPSPATIADTSAPQVPKAENSPAQTPPPATPSWLQETPAALAPVAPQTSAPVAPSAAPAITASSQTPALTEDDLLPPWLKEENDNTKDAQRTNDTVQQNVTVTPPDPTPPTPAPMAPVETVAAPVTAVEPAPAPAPAPVTLPVMETPAATTPAAPQTFAKSPAAPPVPAAPVIAKNPAPVPSVPAQEISAPTPAPVTPPAPAAEPMPIQPVAPSPAIPPAPAQKQTQEKIPATPPAPAPSNAADESAAERERERKRRKRQRYRENLKKRNQDGAMPGPGSGTEKERVMSQPVSPVDVTESPIKPIATPSVQQTPKIVAPSTPAPATKTLPQIPKPAQPPKIPAVPSLATPAKPTVASEQKKPVSMVQPEQKKQTPIAPQKSVQKNHNRAPSPKPAVQHPAPVKPAPVPHSQKPAEKNIPKAVTPASPPAQNSDDKVAFVIKAEGIAKQKPKTQPPQKKNDAQAT